MPPDSGVILTTFVSSITLAIVCLTRLARMSTRSRSAPGSRPAVISTTVEISSLTQLSRLMERLETVKDVHTVAREGNLAAT